MNKIKLSRSYNGKRTLLSSRRPAGDIPVEADVRKYLEQRLTRLWRACAREFFIELTKHIHVDTGMSYASVLPLARKVAIASKLMAGSTHTRKSHTAPGGEYMQNTPSSVVTGERYGRAAIDQGRHLIEFGTANNLHWRFRFEIVVFQYELHDPKWKSIAAAERAFKAYWKKNIKKYITVTDFVGWIVQGRIRGIEDAD